MLKLWKVFGEILSFAYGDCEQQMSRSLPSSLITIRHNYSTQIRYCNKRKLGKCDVGENRKAAGAVLLYISKNNTKYQHQL